MIKTILHLSFLFCVLLSGIQAHAWGRRGHSIVCQTAAYLASETSKEAPHFLKVHSFDLGYYCNVPDIIWKRPASYAKESNNHFMDLEHFDKGIPQADIQANPSPFKMSRLEFNKKYPNLAEKSGRSWFRIQELEEKIKKITEDLKNEKLTREQRQELQVQWLMHTGVIGHYIGDLAMPLHVSENYDGQMTDQKGIHHYFEEVAVDELFLQKGFSLEHSVYKKALDLKKKFDKQGKGKDLLTLSQELSRDSSKNVERLLKTDKKNGRKELDKTSKAFRDLLVERLAQGAVVQAHLFQSHLGWKFDGEKFYKFMETPPFIEPPTDNSDSKKK